MAQPVTQTVASWIATQRVAVSLALILALVGLSIPYGASTPLEEGNLTIFEWTWRPRRIVSIAALVAAVGLAIDLARPLRQRWRFSGIAYLLAAAVFAAAATYELFYVSRIGWGFAISQLLIHAAIAGIALYEWRRVALEPRLVATDG